MDELLKIQVIVDADLGKILLHPDARVLRPKPIFGTRDVPLIVKTRLWLTVRFLSSICCRASIKLRIISWSGVLRA